MSIAATAVAETAIAEPANEPVRKTPPKRVTTAKRDSAAAAEPR